MGIQALASLEMNMGKAPSQPQVAPVEVKEYTSAKKSSEQPSESEQSAQTMETLKSMVSSVMDDIDKADLTGNRLAFSSDEETGATIIQIIDNDTGETVRQIPPEEVVKLRKRIGEIQGLLLDKKV